MALCSLSRSAKRLDRDPSPERSEAPIESGFVNVVKPQEKMKQGEDAKKIDAAGPMVVRRTIKMFLISCLNG